MAVVKPFKAMRFNCCSNELNQLVCPPYDIISEQERLDFIEKNPHNIIRLELPKEGENPYEVAGDVLSDWLQENVLKKDEKAGYYVYSIDFTVKGEVKTVRGMVARVKIEEFSKGVVLPHEETLSKAKEDRLNLMKATNCNFSQIYCLYMQDLTIEGIVNAQTNRDPDVKITDAEGLVHRLWIIDDEDACAQISKCFEDKKLYIADGHHRYETALNYRNYLRSEGKATEGDACDDIMMFLADMGQEGLVVFPTHRIVRDLENFDAQKLLEGAKADFDLIENVSVADAEKELETLYNNGKIAFAMYTGGETVTIMVCKTCGVCEDVMCGSAALRGLDVTVLHTMVLEKGLGIDKENMAKQINLTYTKFAEEAYNSVKEGKANCSFILNPTRVDEIRDVALAGEKMPQKSTYFYPKLITGLVMNKID